MKVHKRPWLRVAGSGLLSAAALSSTAFAQTQTTALEEVVVTAERRESDLQETAVSVTAINSEAIADMHVVNVRELAEYVPNLAISPSVYGDAAPNIVIRGVGGGQSLASFGAASERNVAMYIDGLYYPRTFGSIMNVTEIESVEVLRGPQGTLFGRNTTGGAISYRSKKASITDGLSGFGEVEVGSFGRFNYKGGINIPLGESWAALIQAAKLKSDGFVERGSDPLNDDDTIATSLQIHGEPTENLKVDFNYSYSDSETNGIPSNFTALTWNENTDPNDTTRGLRGHLGALSKYLAAANQGRLQQNDPRLLLGDEKAPRYCILDDNDPFTMGELCDTFNKRNLHATSIKLAYDINDNIQFSTLTGAVISGVDTRTDTYYTGAYARDFDQSSNSFQQELQLNLTYDKWHAVAGVVYFSENADENELTTERLMTSYANNSDVLRQRRKESYNYGTESFAVYSQGSYSFTNWFELTGGLRYSEDKKDARIQYIPTADDPRNRQAFGDNSWDSLDWKLSAQFRVTDDIMLFAGKSKAFKAGIADDASAERTPSGSAVNAPLILPVTFADPEEVTAFEVGLRSEWFDNRLRFNLTYFDQDWSDRHTSQNVTVNYGGTIGNVLVVGVGNDKGVINIKGVEAETVYAITDSLTFNASYGLTDAEKKNDPTYILDSVPEYNATAGLAHGLDLFGGRVTSTLSYTYRDKSFSFSGNGLTENDTSFIDGYGLFNLNIGYKPDSGKWQASVYVRNLTDEEYTAGSFSISGYGAIDFTQPVANNAAPRVQFAGQPRTVGATFRYNFGL